MKSPHLSLRLLALGGIAVFAGAFCVRCGSDVDGTSIDGGVDAVDLDADSDAEVWDPVWHKTEPAEWPTVGPEGQPDCGPGCRVALNLPVTHPGYFSYGYDDSSVGDTTNGNIRNERDDKAHFRLAEQSPRQVWAGGGQRHRRLDGALSDVRSEPRDTERAHVLVNARPPRPGDRRKVPN